MDLQVIMASPPLIESIDCCIRRLGICISYDRQNPDLFNHGQQLKIQLLLGTACTYCCCSKYELVPNMVYASNAMG